MADLRRWIIALAVLVVFSGLASAQISGGGGTQLICSVNTSATPTLRSEGITEEVGDIVITCTGGTPLAPGASIPLVNITVSLTSQVTSRLVASGGVSEALLMLLSVVALSLVANAGCEPQGAQSAQSAQSAQGAQGAQGAQSAQSA